MGNPYAGLDEAGAGNVAMGAGLRPTTKGVEKPPDPKVRAPALDPTGSGGRGREAPAHHNLGDLCLENISLRSVVVQIYDLNFAQRAISFTFHGRAQY